MDNAVCIRHNVKNYESVVRGEKRRIVGGQPSYGYVRGRQHENVLCGDLHRMQTNCNGHKALLLSGLEWLAVIRSEGKLKWARKAIMKRIGEVTCPLSKGVLRVLKGMCARRFN